MILNSVLIAFSFALLLFCADNFVKSAVAIANKLHCSPMMIGLTIVSVGTSLPELTICLMSASQEAEELALGNIIGSNIANILLVLGGTAVISKITRPKTFKKDALFLTLATLFLLPFIFIGSLKWWSGIVMLLIFVTFLLKSIKGGKKHKEEEEDETTHSPWAVKSWTFVTIALALSMVGIIFASNTLVDNAILIAHSFGVSEEVIGLTIIAFGTSLPEISASWMAAYKGRTELSIGNVMGSNIANITFIMGITSLSTPIVFYQGIATDIGVMIAATLGLILVFAVKGEIKRSTGLLFLIAYALYIFAKL